MTILHPSVFNKKFVQLPPANIAEVRNPRAVYSNIAFVLAAFILLAFPPSLSMATNYTWDGGGSLDRWSTSGNWNPNAVPTYNSTNNLIFAGVTRLTPDNNAVGKIIGNISFSSTAGAFTLGGSALTIHGGITNNDADLQTVDMGMTLGASQTFNAASGALTIGGAITTGGFGLTVNGANATSIGGIISGAGSLTKIGAGTLTLTGANTYTGTTTISAGVLNIQNADALGTTAGATSVTSGAALEIQGGVTTGAEALTLNGTGISNGGALRNISGATTYAGAITLGSATRINTDGGTMTLSNTISGAGQNLTVGGAGNTNIGGAITTTTGTFTKDGAGTVTFNANANTYTGLTTVNGGTLLLSKSAGVNSIAGDVKITSGTLQLGSANQIANGSAVELAGGTLNTGGLNETVGALTLSANSTVDFGPGASILFFSSGMRTGGTLNITNWDGNTTGGGTDQLAFNTSIGSMVNFITFNGGAYGAVEISFGGHFEIVPVPEPTTILAGCLLLVFIGWREHSRILLLISRIYRKPA